MDYCGVADEAFAAMFCGYLCHPVSTPFVYQNWAQIQAACRFRERWKKQLHFVLLVLVFSAVLYCVVYRDHDRPAVGVLLTAFRSHSLCTASQRVVGQTRDVASAGSPSSHGGGVQLR